MNMDEEDPYQPIGAKFKARQLLLVLLILLLAAFIVVWFQKEAIADNFVQNELEALGIPASYEVSEIGFNKQRLSNVVIGDPKKPDFTADSIEIGVGVGIDGVAVRRLKLENGKLYGKYSGGKLSFGVLDALSDRSSTDPIAIPDLWAEIDALGIKLSTEYGDVGAKLTGKGNLRSGFVGELAAVSSELKVAECDIKNPSLYADVRIVASRPSFEGPLRFTSLKCEEIGVDVQGFAGATKLGLSKALDAWDLQSDLLLSSAAIGEFKAEKPNGLIEFNGGWDAAKGKIDIQSAGLASGPLQAATMKLAGQMSVGTSGETMSLAFSGSTKMSGGQLARSDLKKIRAAGRSAAGLPIAPLLEKITLQSAKALSNFDVSSQIEFAIADGRTKATFRDARINSDSDARVTLEDQFVIRSTKDGWSGVLDGAVSLSGGDLPQMTLKLDPNSATGAVSGQMFIRPYKAGGASFVLPAIRFVQSRSGRFKFDGKAIVSGPLFDGRVEQLALPIKGSADLNGNIRLLETCANIGFSMLKVASVNLDKNVIRVCPNGQKSVFAINGGKLAMALSVPELKLAGMLGDSPLNIDSTAIGYDRSGAFSGNDISIRFGKAHVVNSLDIAELTGKVTESGFAGTMSGGEGAIANVPIEFSKINGEWEFVDGILDVNSALLIKDAEQVDRFKPIYAEGAKLRLQDNVVTADANLVSPVALKKIAKVELIHSLETGTGFADLKVEKLTFNDGLQPEELTPLTLGMVANVKGQVDGKGRIDWDDDSVSSHGVFESKGLDLAAAFGPVRQLKGKIKFSDLLAFETFPHQLITLDEVNPGVAVTDGEIRFQLLPEQVLRIEGGRWPFAGGELLLESASLNMTVEEDRKLSFEINGVEAARFLHKFEFENINATGQFDGHLPMVFNQDGGKIVGGRLKVRKGGGTIAYVGELSNKDVGALGNFAFGALKAIQYESLSIGMDGALDGEIITEVKFRGIQQGETANQNFITRQLASLPIQFNVRIKAPFMQLISSAKSFYDPNILVTQNLSALIESQKATEALKSDKSKVNGSKQAVQPRESEPGL